MINNADIVLRAISIHALLAESDLGLKACKAPLANFNPRSPCGERPGVCIKCDSWQDISIHALLAESDTPRTEPCS